MRVSLGCDVGERDISWKNANHAFYILQTIISVLLLEFY